MKKLAPLLVLGLVLLAARGAKGKGPPKRAPGPPAPPRGGTKYVRAVEGKRYLLELGWDTDTLAELLSKGDGTLALSPTERADAARSFVRSLAFSADEGEPTNVSAPPAYVNVHATAMTTRAVAIPTKQKGQLFFLARLTELGAAVP